MNQQRYSQTELEHAAKQIEHWRTSLSKSYHAELWDMARISNYAVAVLARDSQQDPLFPHWNTKAIAQAYLERDVPRRRRWLNAALHILEFADAKLRADFILGEAQQRERLVNWVIGRGGIYDRCNRPTNPPFVETPE